MIRIAAVISCVMLAGAGQASPPKPAPAAGSIAGTVVDARTGAPIRHALVTLGGLRDGSLPTINTDDAGQFRINIKVLPAGRYDLFVEAAGFLRAEYNNDDRSAPDASIPLEGGQHRTDVIVRMIRGAVVTGRLTNRLGEPVPGVEVTLQSVRADNRLRNGSSRQDFVNGANTDDRGIYRLRDVRAGEYRVMTTAESQMDGLSMGPGRDQIPVLSHAAVDAVKRATTAAPATSPSAAMRRMIVMPTFYPGTVRASDAVAISVGEGDERTGIDFVMQTVPALSVHGRVVLPGGVTAARTVLRIFAASAAEYDRGLFMRPSSDADGAFTINDLATGDYVVTAETFVASREGPAATFDRWAASVPVTVADRDVADLVIEPSPGISVMGRVQFEGETMSPDPLKDLRVTLRALVSNNEVAIGALPAAVDANGRFRIPGVMPGRYVFQLTTPNAMNEPKGGWWLKSASVNGRDAADLPVTISATDISDAVVVMSRRPSQISGKLLDAWSAPVRGRWVVMFPVNRIYWTTAKSRRIIGTRSSDDGTFRIRDLPAGDYLLAVARGTELDRDEWFDIAILERLALDAARVTLGEGENTVRNLRVRR